MEGGASGMRLTHANCDGGVGGVCSSNSELSCAGRTPLMCARVSASRK